MITASRAYQFGAFTLDLDRQQLLLAGRRITLARKNFEVLHILVEAAGRIVSRDELVCAVWPDAVVEESTLRQNIYTLRAQLRELDPERDYVETVPKAGYRIAVPVEPLVEKEPIPDLPASRMDTGSRRRWTWFTVALSVALGLGVWALQKRIGRDGGSSAAHLSESDLIAQGWLILDRRDAAEFPAAQALFDDALRMDPRSVPAHSGRAVLLTLRGNEQQALLEASRIEEIDPTSGAPAAVRGFLKMMNHWAWSEAGTLLKQAWRQGCPDSFCQQWNALFLALTGHFPQAVREASYALERSPTRLAARAQYGQILYWAGETDRAIDELQTVVDLSGNATHARLHLWKAQLASGDAVAASRTVLIAIDPNWFRLSPADAMSQLRRQPNLLGKPDFFRRLLAIDEGMRGYPYFLAELAMAAGDRERALKELERALSQRNFYLPFAKRDPLFVPLHGDPRYEAIMRQVGL